MEAMRETQRRQKGADDFYKKQLLTKCLRSWNIWVRAQLLEKDLEREKVETQRKMEAFLKACAIDGGDDDGIGTTNNDDAVEKGPEGTGANRPPRPKKLQPWQVTKKHVYEGMPATPDAEKTGGGDTTKKSTKAAFVVDTFQHRHQAQEKMLKTQQEIIKVRIKGRLSSYAVVVTSDAWY